MKLVLPDLPITESTGFEPEVDIFKRAEFGKRLANLIENAGGNPVIALDAGWGQGKSTFIKMWRGYLEHHRDKKIRTIYFDAFENDYQKDPFLALASEMYQLISDDNEPKKFEFKDKAIKAGKSLLRGSLKLGVRTITAGLVDNTMLDAAESELSGLVADQVDELVKDRFEHAQKDKLALKEFKSYLAQFAEEQGKGEPIVFIIDELDRCRPDFALELLEQVKHLFSVKGITFLLVTNREQLEQSIKAKYGDNDPVNYLHKFINVWLALPRAAEKYNDHGYQYLQYAMKAMLAGENQKLGESHNVLLDIVQYYQPSFREIERILAYFAILSNMVSPNSQYVEDIQRIIGLVCYLKVCKPYVLKLANGNLSYEQIVAAANFDDIQQTERFFELEKLARRVKFDFGNKELRQKMIDDKEIYVGYSHRPHPNYLVEINQWLTNIIN